jgi:hypothetical protein
MKAMPALPPEVVEASREKPGQFYSIPASLNSFYSIPITLVPPASTVVLSTPCKHSWHPTPHASFECRHCKANIDYHALKAYMHSSLGGAQAPATLEEACDRLWAAGQNAGQVYRGVP